MTERPILFSGPMVRAILSGSKSQTRRVVKEPSWATPHTLHLFNGAPWASDPLRGDRDVPCPYGQPGDRLWVREAFRLCAEADATKPRDTDAAYRIWYEADSYAGHWHQPGYGKLRPGIHMPRWASRITLEIVGVRVERLQDISDEDSLAEGVYPTRTGLYPGSPRFAYRKLWDDINGPGSWDANPWVRVITFRRITP